MKMNKLNSGSHIVPVLAAIMYDDILPCFNKNFPDKICPEGVHSEKNDKDIIAFAECYIR